MFGTEVAMPHEYEIAEFAKEESWRMFRIIGEMVEGFDTLSDIEPAVSIYGSARLKENEKLILCENCGRILYWPKKKT